MTLQVICVAYERPVALRVLIDCFILQTDKRWYLHIIYDGQAPDDIKEIIGAYNDDRVNFYCSEKRNQNYGHPNRRMMLDKLAGQHDDYVLLTNDDNYYIPLYVEQMLAKCSRSVGMVSCNTVHSHFGYGVHESRLTEGGIDMGAFIVRYDIAKAVGFHYDHFSADGKYAEECAMLCKTNKMDIIHIDKPYFIHN